MDALEADHEFLLKGDVFTRDVLDMGLSCKRENEVEPVRLRPHPYKGAEKTDWEVEFGVVAFHLYYDIWDPRPSPEDGGRSPDPIGAAWMPVIVKDSDSQTDPLPARPLVCMSGVVGY